MDRRSVSRCPSNNFINDIIFQDYNRKHYKFFLMIEDFESSQIMKSKSGAAIQCNSDVILRIILIAIICSISIGLCAKGRIQFKRALEFGKDTKCEYIFIDAGSNVGDNLDVFAGIQDNGEITTLKNHIMKKHHVSEKNFCVFGFEGNSEFTSTLHQKENELKSIFKRIEVSN